MFTSSVIWRKWVKWEFDIIYRISPLLRPVMSSAKVETCRPRVDFVSSVIDSSATWITSSHIKGRHPWSKDAFVGEVLPCWRGVAGVSCITSGQGSVQLLKCSMTFSPPCINMCTLSILRITARCYYCIHMISYLKISTKLIKSSSCRAAGTDIPDPFSLPLPIVHRFWPVLGATPRILTEQRYVGSI